MREEIIYCDIHRLGNEIDSTSYVLLWLQKSLLPGGEKGMIVLLLDEHIVREYRKVLARS